MKGKGVARVEDGGGGFMGAHVKMLATCTIITRTRDQRNT